MTVKNKEFFLQKFQKQMQFKKRFTHSNIGYGEDVIPILDLYAGLSNFDERISFKDALEDFLADPDSSKRNFAVDICMGFFVFRDAIAR